jgi:hypothetical protein
MKLQRREKILAAATGGMLVLLVFWFLFMMGDSRSSARLHADLVRLASDIQNKEKMLAAAATDAKQLDQWRRRSLPSDVTIARSLYQNWLRSAANRADFRRMNIDSKEGEARREVFTRLSFTLHGHIRLSGLVEFLYEFYSAGHLQQIRQLDIKPLQNSRDLLDVNMTIEALSLPGADSKDHLSKEPGKGLRLAKLAEYRDPILERNLFAPFVPPTTVRRDDTVDIAQFTFVTAFVEVDGARQVWLQDRVAGKTIKLASGETFQVAGVPGTVQAILPNETAIVDFDGRRRRLALSDNLRGGVELPDEGEKTSAGTSEQ